MRVQSRLSSFEDEIYLNCTLLCVYSSSAHPWTLSSLLEKLCKSVTLIFKFFALALGMGWSRHEVIYELLQGHHS